MHRSSFFLSCLSFLALSLACTAAHAEDSDRLSAPNAPRGPDVTVFELPATTNHGAAGGIRGYSVATTSCNIGTDPLSWCDSTNGCGIGANGVPTTSRDHPVIGQNMYRLHNGRFDQIGASWLKHGFLSLNQNPTSGDGVCGPGTCTTPPLGGRQLGVGCTDPYSAPRNGSLPLGRKSEVNASTGAYPFPFGGGGAQSAVWNQRVAVAQSDLTLAQFPGARFFVEGQYIAPDDAVAGNGLNNASYAEVTVNQSSFNLTLTGPNQNKTVREKSAIEAWPVIDPTVELLNVDVVQAGQPVERFHVARKITQPSPGLWHYEYAVHNLNSDRAASRLTVNFFGSAIISGTGFHDVDAHSNEPYDTTDWPANVTTSSVEWQAPPFPGSPSNANAIRWSTMYNFWFDSNRGPEEISSHALGLFKTGTPAEVVFMQNTAPVMFENGFETNVVSKP